MPFRVLTIAALLLLTTALPVLAQAGPASTPGAQAASPLRVQLAPDPANPPSPQMGDRLTFRSTIENTGTAPVRGLVAWLGLVQVDAGLEQPVDLEDWSAHKAVTVPMLEPGQSVSSAWAMRLIASGHYRVVVSAAAGEGALSPSPFLDVAVRQKPVVESGRVLPVALGIPALLVGGLVLQQRRSRRGSL